MPKDLMGNVASVTEPSFCGTREWALHIGDKDSSTELLPLAS